jgi:hypothetical protein
LSSRLSTRWQAASRWPLSTSQPPPCTFWR